MDPLTQKEKEDKIYTIINRLIHIGKYFAGVQLHNKLETLKQVTEIWKNGNMCKVKEEKKVRKIF